MALTPFSLAQAIASIGVAEVFVGDPMTTGGLTSLGAIEGTITFNAPETLNSLTAPELTGEVAHSAVVTPGQVTVTCPVIISSQSVLLKISPRGKASMGNSVPQQVTTTSVLIIPRAELGGGLTNSAATYTRTAGNGVAGATGAGAAPVYSIWIWKAVPTFPSLPYQFSNGGKVIVEVTFTAFFDATKPEDHKIYTIGDPRAVTPTPIAINL